MKMPGLFCEGTEGLSHSTQAKIKVYAINKE